MATKKKMLQAAAGNAGGAALDITDVFSTYLYEGTGAAQTITNGIDLAGEGGLVWIKSRNNAYDHRLTDTERGIRKSIETQSTEAEADTPHCVSGSFNSDGFSLDYTGNPSAVNTIGDDLVSWTFRKAPKFFDVVTWTGDGTGDRVLNQNVGTVGAVFVKNLTSGDSYSGNWCVHHRSLGTSQSAYLNLNGTSASGQGTGINPVFSSTDTTFTLRGGGGGELNVSGVEYVAYLFAHNDGDGEFGPDGDQDIIKCGSYTGNGSTNGPEIDLGWEPQWFLHKRTDDGDGWPMNDNLRGFDLSTVKTFKANTINTEGNSGAIAHPTATGIKLTTTDAEWNTSGGNYIYIAIRRGPLAKPKSATEVFALEDDGASANSEGVYFTSNFPVDFALLRERTNSSDGWYTMSRLQGSGDYVKTNSSAAEASGVSNGTFDHMTGWYQVGSASMSWMWKRAPGFFDVVAHTGNEVSGRTVSHNLGVAPEMIWTKCRSSSKDWGAYVLGEQGFLNTTNSLENLNRGYSTTTAPTATEFYLDSTDTTNEIGSTYISFLFASLPGVSKVGSYTGNGSGSGQNIDCGFTTGARFILIKRTDSTSNWLVFDTVRGITVGNDPYIKLDVTDAETTNPIVDPYSSGFKLQGTIWNGSGENYIFYAIA